MLLYGSKRYAFQKLQQNLQFRGLISYAGGYSRPPPQWWEVWKLLVYIYKKEVLASCNRLRTSRYYPTDSHTLPTRLSWHFLQKLCFLFDNVLSVFIQSDCSSLHQASFIFCIFLSACSCSCCALCTLCPGRMAVTSLFHTFVFLHSSSTREGGCLSQSCHSNMLQLLV